MWGSRHHKTQVETLASQGLRWETKWLILSRLVINLGILANRGKWSIRRNLYSRSILHLNRQLRLDPTKRWTRFLIRHLNRTRWRSSMRCLLQYKTWIQLFTSQTTRHKLWIKAIKLKPWWNTDNSLSKLIHLANQIIRRSIINNQTLSMITLLTNKRLNKWASEVIINRSRTRCSRGVRIEKSN